jgi:hypothetical protein
MSWAVLSSPLTCNYPTVVSARAVCNNSDVYRKWEIQSKQNIGKRN